VTGGGRAIVAPAGIGELEKTEGQALIGGAAKTGEAASTGEAARTDGRTGLWPRTRGSRGS
jgi:hypothetical protein